MDDQERSPLPTVTEVLGFAEVQAGGAEVAAGARGLHRQVRWAHVAADINIAGSVDGGEIVLMTATAWPSDPARRAVFTEDLIAAGVSAIALELGRGLNAAPRQMKLACDQHDVPLIVLHREVRFVQITQRVHQRILGAQTAALEARDTVHSMLTELGLNRSPVDYVVERLANTLDAPVVLEDSAHRVVAFAAGDADATEALAPWQVAGAPLLSPRTARVAVEARGTRWGYLTALPGPAHPAGRHTVLELGAFALALGRLADADGQQWLQFASKRVFEALLSGRYRNDLELESQLTAAGLPLAKRITFAATLRGVGGFGAHESLEHAILETALRRAVAPEGRVLVSIDADESGALLLALISLPEGDKRAGVDPHHGAPTLASRLAAELTMLVPDPTPDSWRAHLSLGTPGTSLRQLVASLEQLRAAGFISPSTEVGRVSVQQAERQPLAHLVRALSTTPEMQRYTADMLAPLVAHDQATGRGHAGDLIDVLAAYLAHPTNRSLAAQRARLSRSVFYQRLDLIEKLLGFDLADGETIAALSVALLAHRS